MVWNKNVGNDLEQFITHYYWVFGKYVFSIFLLIWRYVGEGEILHGLNIRFDDLYHFS